MLVPPAGRKELIRSSAWITRDWLANIRPTVRPTMNEDPIQEMVESWMRCAQCGLRIINWRSTDSALAAWLSGNALVLINVVALRRARLVLGWVTVRGIKPKPPRSTQPGHPSIGRHNEYWRWSRSPLGKKRRVLRNSGPVPGLLGSWHTGIVG